MFFTVANDLHIVHADHGKAILQWHFRRDCFVSAIHAKQVLARFADDSC